MAAHSGSKLPNRKSTFILDPESKTSSNGEIDPYHIYKEALSDIEVKKLYIAHKRRYK